MAGENKDDRPGLNLAKTLKLSEPERSLVNWLRRNPDSNAEEMAANLAIHFDQVEAILDSLVDQGFVRREQNDRDPTLSLYRLILSKRKRSRLDFRS
ncbi:MAG: MarR family transcriptional regulator [Synechococcaceae cyanobacterium RL_1_2]|nr:MarR family transcriptional regulator [Synechococcaceae cyanobacterium RL_1_2]